MPVDGVTVPFRVAPGVTAATLGYTTAGVCLGVVSGLTPGLHANAFALLLAAAAPSLPGPGVAVGAAMLAAGVVHTFLDVVPALALGVPDAAMAAGSVPGHRLVLDGRGREALRLSALGSVAGALAAVPLAGPLTEVAADIVPALLNSLPVVLGVVAAALLATESSLRSVVGGVAALGASGALGWVVLGFTPAGPLPVTSLLGPLFAGLFGAPVLLTSVVTGGGVPPQGDASVRLGPTRVALTACAGAGTGALVAYLPGVSAGVAATLALPAVPPTGRDRGYVVASSGANTATATFALFALAALGDARTGVTVALRTASVPVVLPTLLPAVGFAAGVGAVLVPTVGDRYLRVARQTDETRLAVAVLVGLAALSALLAGPVGVAVYLVASPVGLLPRATGARRVHLMGALLVPLALGG